MNGGQAGSTSRKPMQQPPQVWRSSREPQEISDPSKGLEFWKATSTVNGNMRLCWGVDQYSSLLALLSSLNWEQCQTPSGLFLGPPAGTGDSQTCEIARRGHTVSELEENLGRSYSLPIRKSLIPAWTIIVNIMILINLSTTYYTI